MWLKHFFWFAGPLSPFSFTMLYSKGEFYNPMWLNLLFCICDLHAEMSNEKPVILALLYCSNVDVKG